MEEAEKRGKGRRKGKAVGSVDSAMVGSETSASVPGASLAVSCGSGVLSSWMTRMLADASDTGVTGSESESIEDRLKAARERGRAGRPEPPPATTLRELYDPAFEVLPSPKWREQLLDRPVHRRSSPHDVAEIVMALEEGPLSEMVAYCDGRANATRVYMAREGSGVWSQAPSVAQRAHEQLKLLKDMALRIERMVIVPLKALARRLTRTELSEASEQERVKRQLLEVEEHLRYVVWLYEKALMTPSFASTVLDCIVTERVAATRLAGVREETFDTAQWCIAFEDGVFDIRSGRLLRDGAAREKMQVGGEPPRTPFLGGLGDAMGARGRYGTLWDAMGATERYGTLWDVMGRYGTARGARRSKRDAKDRAGDR